MSERERQREREREREGEKEQIALPAAEVIDYYDDPRSGDNDDLQITVETRPAIDSLGVLRAKGLFRNDFRGVP